MLHKDAAENFVPKILDSADGRFIIQVTLPSDHGVIVRAKL